MKRLIYLIIVCISFLGTAQEIPFLESEIKVDGVLNEPTWSTLEEYTNFHNYLPTDVGLAEQQTEVKMFHNGEYLYLSAIYRDTENKIQTNSLKRDVLPGLSDAFVLILDTQNQQQNAFYFAVNGYGAQADGIVERVNEGFDITTSWNAVWKTATSVNGTNKIYEVAIPLKFLNYDGENTTFGIQMYVRDIKKNAWSIYNKVSRNYRLFDLRFTKEFKVEKLPKVSPSRFAVTPSLTLNHQEDVINDSDNTSLKPSLDVQYNVTSGLKLDVTINPDFSQIDVDQQVTNLTRFAIFFPERRNFFLENSDLFSNLGVTDVNPFYSRRIGASRDVLLGLKLSGNVSKKTRLGVLNVQTDKNEQLPAQNFSALVGEYQLSDNFTGTGFLINRQEVDELKFIDDYNRVVGLNGNFKSNNNKWIGLVNVAKSLSDSISEKNNFYNLGLWYNEREFNANIGVKSVGRNYLTDVGFTPRLFNYDAVNDEVVREGYLELNGELEYQKFYEDSKTLNNIRFLNYRNNTYFNENGEVSQISHSVNSAVFLKNLSAFYYVLKSDKIDLEYGFDPLGNGNPILPDTYQNSLVKVGYNSANNQNFRYRFNGQYGSYFGGQRTTAGLYLNYQLLPFANIEMNYDINKIDLNDLGEKTFHLARFTGEVFFSNRLSWTTYLQYNTQIDNFNVNSRLQWEYKPLSYIYLVVTDNYTESLDRKNWGVAVKINYRFDF